MHIFRVFASENIFRVLAPKNIVWMFAAVAALPQHESSRRPHAKDAEIPGTIFLHIPLTAVPQTASARYFVFIVFATKYTENLVQQFPAKPCVALNKNGSDA